MNLQGNFMFLSGRTNEGSNGKTYGTVNVECDGYVETYPCNPSLIERMKKLQTYTGLFQSYFYKGQLRMTLIDIKGVQ